MLKLAKNDVKVPKSYIDFGFKEKSVSRHSTDNGALLSHINIRLTHVSFESCALKCRCVVLKRIVLSKATRGTGNVLVCNVYGIGQVGLMCRA